MAATEMTLTKPAAVPSTVRGRETSLLHTTKRGLAAGSFCLGMGSAASFWMYPFGFFLGNAAIALGLLTIVLGFRVGKGTESLAIWGIVFGATGAGAAFTIYRFMQLAFEGTIPTMLP